MMNTKQFRAIFIFTFALISVGSFSQDPRYEQFGPLFDGEDNSHEKLIKEGWIYLFDARVPSKELAVEWSSLDLWRPRRADANNCWMVAREHNEDQERILMNVLQEGMHGTDLISKMEFWNFDLHVEFRSAANSGIYLRGRYEVQIDRAFPKTVEPEHSHLGGIYSVSPPVAVEPAGQDEWQTLDIRLRGYVISVYLNGVLIQDQFLMPEGKKRIGTGTELGCWPTDGFHNDPTKPGPIMIQGNHGEIDIRNIRIRTTSAIE